MNTLRKFFLRCHEMVLYWRIEWAQYLLDDKKETLEKEKEALSSLELEDALERMIIVGSVNELDNEIMELDKKIDRLLFKIMEVIEEEIEEEEKT